MARFQTIDDLEDRQNLLVRIDINVPVVDGIVQDDRRFARHAATVRELLDAGHSVTLLAHQGRPGKETFVSLEQHASLLGDHLGQAVSFVPDTAGEAALAAIDALEPGDVLLLENVRMCEGELPEAAPDVKAETALVRTLAPRFDAFVNDAYSVAHRSHASIVGFPRVMDAYAGRVMEEEHAANTALQDREFDGNVTIVLGGAKADDIIPVIDGLADNADRFCLGGVVGELFLRAAGHEVGYDVAGTELFDRQWDAHGETIERLLETYRDQVVLPTDLAFDDNGTRAETFVEGVTKETPFLDVGAETVVHYVDLIGDSAAVFLKGPLGVVEDERFAYGTLEVLSAIAETDCFSVVGGGDTAHTIEQYGLDETNFTRISLAGGAYVRALRGESLVGVDVLTSGE